MTDPAISLAPLLAKLTSLNLPARIEGSTLIADHGNFVVRAQVVPPLGERQPGREIQAAVQVRSTLPESLAPHLASDTAAFGANRLASFGALTLEDGKAWLGSRITVYQAEDAWDTLQEPLLMYAVLAGPDPMLRALHRQAAGVAGEQGPSDWTADDLERIRQSLAASGECKLEGGHLSVEFPNGALLRIASNQPHPELGGGLATLLEMPYPVEDVVHVCSRLNAMEMAALDSPPHFGAWCGGSLGNNPAYALFLPNAVRLVQGVALNVARWSQARATWADAMLRASGPG